MKAIVTATRDIVEVDQCSVLYDDGRRELMYGKELEEVQGAPDYWEKLFHQYAGMAMQAIISKQTVGHKLNTITDLCCDIAHALVKKLKEKEDK